MKEEQLVEEAKNKFFEAMINGWAGGVDPIELPELPGSKLISFVDGDWKVVDIYWTTEGSNQSHGTTLIYYQNRLVWRMIYEGWYKEEAIPVVKAALLTNYQVHLFYGGRGPERLEITVDNNRYFYSNNLSRFNWFERFSGHEFVECFTTGEELGEHEYSGMWLL